MGQELTYSWQIFNDDSTWEEVGNFSHQLLNIDDLDYQIRAVISYQDDQGFDEKVITDSVLIENIRDFGDFEPNISIESSSWSEIDSTNAYIKALMTGGKWGDVDPSTATTELNYYIYDDETTIENLSARSSFC